MKEEVVSEGMPKVEIRKRRKENLMNKKLHSVFFVKTDFRDSRSWDWLKNGDLKKATEGTIMAAQEQATGTRSIRHPSTRRTFPHSAGYVVREMRQWPMWSLNAKFWRKTNTKTVQG